MPGAAPGPAPPPPPPGSGGEKAPKGVGGHRGFRRIPQDPGAAVPTRDGQEVKGWKVMDQEGTEGGEQGEEGPGDDGLGNKGQEMMSKERMEQETRCRDVEDRER